jgi:hypothetical protein
MSDPEFDVDSAYEEIAVRNPLEDFRRWLADLPPEEQRSVLAALGDEYAGVDPSPIFTLPVGPAPSRNKCPKCGRDL